MIGRNVCSNKSNNLILSDNSHEEALKVEHLDDGYVIIFTFTKPTNRIQ